MLNLTFLGDISFNDLGKNHELDISQFIKLKSDEDFTIANLEALVSIGEYNLLKNPRVTTDAKSLNHLTKLGINLVSLAHNHVYDPKLSGFKATLNKLKSLNISYLGAGLNQQEAAKPYILNSEGIKIGFLNYCTTDTNPSLPEDCEVFINWYNAEKVEDDILNLRKTCDHVILLLHWGGSFEGGYFPDKYQHKDAERFSEAGASLIVGHHPHTLQPNIKYKTTPIYFSLGNFIFYDVKYNNRIIKLSRRRKNGGVLKIKFLPNKSIVEKLYFTKQTKAKLEIRSFNLKNSLNNILYKQFHNSSLFYSLYNFNFKFINPLVYFVITQEGGIAKYRNLNLLKVKNFLWKK